MNHPHFLMFGKQETVLYNDVDFQAACSKNTISNTCQRHWLIYHHWSHSQGTHTNKRQLPSRPVTAKSATPAILQNRHLKRRFCYSEWHKAKKSLPVNTRPLFRVPRKRALCSRPSWLLVSMCTMLETVLVTSLNVRYARDRPGY